MMHKARHQHPLIYIRMSHTHEIGFHVISQGGGGGYFNIPAHKSGVVLHFAATREKWTTLEHINSNDNT